jgi:hypothetical protein
MTKETVDGVRRKGRKIMIYSSSLTPYAVFFVVKLRIDVYNLHAEILD